MMRLFEPAPGLVAVTGYNGRGVTTGSVVGKAFAVGVLVVDDRDFLALEHVDNVIAGDDALLVVTVIRVL